VGLQLDGRGAVRDLVSAARRADEAGFDLLELDLARPDRDLFDAVRAVWPAARPISVNLSAVEDPVELARTLRARGCDIVRIERPALSDRIRLEADVPTMTAAASADIDSLLAAGRADLCLLAGPPSRSQAGGFALTDRSA
jgi:anthraniloyl-CoA monooxygenase